MRSRIMYTGTKIEKILGINAEHKDFPYSRVKEYIAKQIPKIGESRVFRKNTKVGRKRRG